jgi:hypothetical protein
MAGVSMVPTAKTQGSYDNAAIANKGLRLL